jgi:hypothetical protein
MSLLARSVATLEGIALAGDPGYQMVAQVQLSVTSFFLSSMGSFWVTFGCAWGASGSARCTPLCAWRRVAP